MSNSDEEKHLKDLEGFITEAFSYPIAVMNEVLYLIGSRTECTDFTIAKGDLKKLIYGSNITINDDMEYKFNSSIRILAAWKFIKVDGIRIELASEGFKLYEIIETEQDYKKPYSFFLLRKQRISKNKDLLLKESIKTNKNTRMTNGILIIVFSLTMILSGVMVYYTKQSYNLEVMKVNGNNPTKSLQPGILPKDSLIGRKYKNTH